MIFEYKIYYEDTDAGGVVYYANYLKFLERARTDLLTQGGISQVNISRSGVLFAVQHCNIKYISSAKLEDTISVTCSVNKLRGASVEFLQTICLQKKLIVHAIVNVVCVKTKNGTFKPTAIPCNVKTILAKIS